MFKIGDEVRVLSSGALGIVGYVEDGYISVGLDNGAEMDFTDEASLQHEADFIASVAAERDAAIHYDVKTHSMMVPPSAIDKLMAMPYVPRKGDRQLAASVMTMVKKIFPMIVDGARANHEGYDGLDAFDQVKILSQVTGTPMLVFMGAAEMGNETMMRAVLQKTLINNIVEGGDLVGDMLLGKAKRVIADYEKE